MKYVSHFFQGSMVCDGTDRGTGAALDKNPSSSKQTMTHSYDDSLQL